MSPDDRTVRISFGACCKHRGFVEVRENDFVGVQENDFVGVRECVFVDVPQYEIVDVREYASVDVTGGGEFIGCWSRTPAACRNERKVNGPTPQYHRRYRHRPSSPTYPAIVNPVSVFANLIGTKPTTGRGPAKKHQLVSRKNVFVFDGDVELLNLNEAKSLRNNFVTSSLVHVITVGNDYHNQMPQPPLTSPTNTKTKTATTVALSDVEKHNQTWPWFVVDRTAVAIPPVYFPGFRGSARRYAYITRTKKHTILHVADKTFSTMPSHNVP